MKILLSGATGFIGAQLLTALNKAGYEIVAITRVISKVPENLIALSNVIWLPLESDIKDKIEYQGPFDAIIHLATRYGRERGRWLEVERANVSFPLMLLEYSVSSGCSLFINTDSFFSRDEYDYPYMREYILTKKFFSAWGRLAAEKNPCFCFINARLEHVYGPGDRMDKFIPKLLVDLIVGKSEIQLTTCEQRRDIIFSTDVVNAYLLLLASSVELRGYLEIGVGTGQSIPLKEFVLAARNAARSNSILSFGSIPQRQNEIMNSCADTSYLFSRGWKPIVELQEGLNLTLKWLRSSDR